MVWATLWALVFGFGLSGFIQAFISKRALRRSLGDRRVISLVRASLFGMASSSCSYAASAMAKSLFAGGADFVTSMVFMFASTNLVLELGIVLLVLLGWPFLAAEIVGGLIMIVLLSLAGSAVFRGERLAGLERRVRGTDRSHQRDHETGESAVKFVVKVRSIGSWADAATYTIGDLKMLRKELVIGFLIAGYLSALVPVHLWSALFVSGHGALTSVENAFLGPLVAIVSFVCSVGNLPLAAALWSGGISFGGVISFIFADLITLPLLLIYRRQYGPVVMTWMLGVSWVVMALAGLATEALFSVLGLTPTSHPRVIVSAATFGFNGTTVLDLLALVVVAGMYYLAHNRDRWSTDNRYARDVICGMQVETETAPARLELDGHTYYFCSEHCQERFVLDPSRYLERSNVSTVTDNLRSQTERYAEDPICHMTVEISPGTLSAEVGGETYYFCGEGCRASFLQRH
jgi:YHS domain-containing protein/uncharacterized membrane protein YraQ (UPF0718 family)